jgi:hypothetical protein
LLFQISSLILKREYHSGVGRAEFAHDQEVLAIRQLVRKHSVPDIFLWDGVGFFLSVFAAWWDWNG